MTYSWQLYDIHAGALVWRSPVDVEGNARLRAMVSEALYEWARTPWRPDAEPMLHLIDQGERSAYSGLLAYMCGYTGGPA